MRACLLILTGLLLTFKSFALDLSALSQADAAGGLREALAQGAAAAIQQLGAENGFLGNDKVKIPLPPALQKVQGGLRMLGLNKQADELVVAMNRAAEQAMPEAKALMVQAVKSMSLQDAKGILQGGETAGTDYFRQKTSADLTARMLPIVTRTTQKVGLASRYNELAGKASSLGLVSAGDAKIESYVTAKAVDGLFLMVAEQEKALRRDPLRAATGLARAVFGQLKP